MTPARPTPRASPAAAVVSAAAVTVALGLLFVVVLVVAAWSTDPRSGAGSRDAVRAGALAWLVAHRVPVGDFGLPPLGLTGLLGALAARQVRDAVRRTGPGPARRALLTGASFAVPYAGLAGLVAAAAGRAGLVTALATAAVFGIVTGMAGAAWATGLPPLPERPAAVAAGAGAALAVLVVTGALGAGVSLGWHAVRAADLARALDPGPVGLVLLAVVGLAYLPNAVIWGACFALGTGFAVGAGTLVAPTGVRIGPLPAFPLLAALPGAGAAPLPSLLLLGGAVAAGVVSGLVVTRRLPAATPGAAAAWALAAGPLAAVVVCLAAWLSGGPAGPGRLATAGPNPLLAAIAAAEWVGLVGAATAALAARRRAG